MGVTIHEDFWEAACDLPKKQKSEFILAILEYGFEGKWPEGNPPWLRMLKLIRGRIDKGNDASEKASKMANARWHKHDAQAECTSTMHEHDAQAECGGKVSRGKVSRGEIPPIAPQVIAYLNEKTGKSFKPESRASQRLISGRQSEGYTLDDFKRVIDNKCATWLDDPKMEQFLRPDTLFRPTKFESYLNENPSKAARKYEKYNR